MPVPANIFLSRLQPLAGYLAKGTTIDSGLLEVLEDLLPPKQLNKVAKLLDALLEHPAGARALMLTVRFLLDEWLEEGEDKLKAINRDLDPYAWLATSDHLEVVQTFRELL
ncbi:hypothetical protein [Hymenobacter cheonanensis]|uniref:hypothetical protein n=1 Tax=Hymenobacter sp. CA2-7 TaxID=3063993 RepID=UPI0027139868|nr:hypothetical protein [Hymenobacter sp. CA2-7]MDO7885350.1 hypothetical protein [Hymenobacter sp. CA2-7]